MAHLTKDKSILIARIKRIIGQLESVISDIESDQNCGTTLQTVASCRGAINGLTVEILKEHIQSHVIQSKSGKMSKQDLAALEVINALKSYIK